MQGELLMGALLLAAAFATAGGAKLVDLEGSRKAVAGFGVPPKLASPVGTLLPLAEVVTAALLAAGALAVDEVLRVGALAAALLLSTFCVAIAVSVARGRAPDCHCFGQLHSAPAGKRTLIRNGVLLSIAVLVASGGDLAWTLGSAVTVLATLGVLVLASDSRASQSAGLALRARAPDFQLPALEGGTVSLAGLCERGHPVLLVFSASDCGPCIALAPDIAEWQRRHARELTIAVVEGSARAGPEDHGRQDVLLQRDREVADAYGVPGTPSAVLVSKEGHIASDVAVGDSAITALLARTLPAFETPEHERPFARRALITRAVAAGAGVAAVLSAPAWGVAELVRCRYARCGDRCCPRSAKCGRRAGRRVCICPDEREACGNSCCPPTFECRTFRRGRRRVRRCVCPVGRVVCAGRCVRTRTDPNHCGQCGVRCPVGRSCVEGRCVVGDGSGSGPGGSGRCECPRGQACCDGQCTDLNTSEQHCGRCDLACPEGKTCCEGRCRNVENDPQNCGTCGKRCASGEVCGEGECRRRCPPNQSNCNGRCLNVRGSDADNCGRCGFRCKGATDTGECCGDVCCSYNVQTCCPGGCTNLSLDDTNCGGCGVVCGPNSFCRFGTCTCPIPPCP